MVEHTGNPGEETSAEMFERFKAEAREMPKSEVERHALVSTQNRHKCDSCFCCACVEVLAEAGQ